MAKTSLPNTIVRFFIFALILSVALNALHLIWQYNTEGNRNSNINSHGEYSDAPENMNKTGKAKTTNKGRGAIITPKIEGNKSAKEELNARTLARNNIKDDKHDNESNHENAPPPPQKSSQTADNNIRRSELVAVDDTSTISHIGTDTKTDTSIRKWDDVNDNDSIIDNLNGRDHPEANPKNKTCNKSYIFVLVPPWQGSTVLYELVASSNQATSFLSEPIWQGEGEELYKNSSGIDFKKYWRNRWDPEYPLNMTAVKQCYDEHWDLRKNIFVEKSTSMISRAKMYQDYFSQFGCVYFVISIRNPYGMRKNFNMSYWIKSAEFQRKNIQTLSNVVITDYAELCNNVSQVSNKIIEAIPQLEYLSIANSVRKGRENRHHTHGIVLQGKANRMIDVENRTKVLNKSEELMNFFGFQLQ